MDWYLFSPLIIKDQDLPADHARWLKRAEQLMPEVHANRRHQWAYGRVALMEAFRARGLELSLHIEFTGFQQVRDFPQWRFSLSHTVGHAAALVVPEKIGRGVGLDIELSSRQVNQGVQERMHHAGDDGHLSPIQLWSVKEAAYKTLPHVIQQSIWLKSIIVNGAGFRVDGHPQLRGHWKQQPHSELIVMMAQVT